MMRTWAAAMVPGIAAAQTTPQSSAQGNLAVTIYNNDQALVQDTREITLGTGVTRQEFPDVSDAIRPETVRLSIADAAIVEQNFDYDLLSPTALIEKAVGQMITIVRTNPATGQRPGNVQRYSPRTAALSSRSARVSRFCATTVCPSVPPERRFPLLLTPLWRGLFCTRAASQPSVVSPLTLWREAPIVGSSCSMIGFHRFLSTDKERRLAREQALYAMEDHGDGAETYLASKADQTRSISRRRIYKLAIEEVRKLTQR